MADANTVPANWDSHPGQFQLAAMDYNRNPYFRYQLMQKLASVVEQPLQRLRHLDHSGLFRGPALRRVRRMPTETGLPRRLPVGPGVGSDTGNVTRHRAFYIFDRSLPVGFIRGQDINSSNGVSG